MATDSHLYMKPTPEGLEKIDRLRAKVIELDDLIDELTKDKETSVISHHLSGSHVAVGRAKERLEECRMHAINAIVRKHNEGVEKPTLCVCCQKPADTSTPDDANMCYKCFGEFNANVCDQMEERFRDLLARDYPSADIDDALDPMRPLPELG